MNVCQACIKFTTRTFGSGGSKMAPAIPDRWLNYKPVGKRVEGTRFIAFKVPLRRNVIKSVEEDYRLDPQKLLKVIPNLGMIIDLTNTNRYYDPTFFEDNGLRYRKLMIPGHQTPSARLVNEFKWHVFSFISSNMDNDKLIGVHCTHGVNRTGYLICNYMISEMSMKPEDAIIKFAAARGHHIERENYLCDLRLLPMRKNEGRRSGALSASSSITSSTNSTCCAARYVQSATVCPTTWRNCGTATTWSRPIQAADVLFKRNNFKEQQCFHQRSDFDFGRTNPYVTRTSNAEDYKTRREPWSTRYYETRPTGYYRNPYENPFNSINLHKKLKERKERKERKAHKEPSHSNELGKWRK